MEEQHRSKRAGKRPTQTRCKSVKCKDILLNGAKTQIGEFVQHGDKIVKPNGTIEEFDIQNFDIDALDNIISSIKIKISWRAPDIANTLKKEKNVLPCTIYNTLHAPPPPAPLLYLQDGPSSRKQEQKALYAMVVRPPILPVGNVLKNLKPPSAQTE